MKAGVVAGVPVSGVPVSAEGVPVGLRARSLDGDEQSQEPIVGPALHEMALRFWVSYADAAIGHADEPTREDVEHEQARERFEVPIHLERQHDEENPPGAQRRVHRDRSWYHDDARPPKRR